MVDDEADYIIFTINYATALVSHCSIHMRFCVWLVCFIMSILE